MKLRDFLRVIYSKTELSIYKKLSGGSVDSYDYKDLYSGYKDSVPEELLDCMVLISGLSIDKQRLDIQVE